MTKMLANAWNEGFEAVILIGTIMYVPIFIAVATAS